MFKKDHVQETILHQLFRRWYLGPIGNVTIDYLI